MNNNWTTIALLATALALTACSKPKSEPAPAADVTPAPVEAPVAPAADAATTPAAGGERGIDDRGIDDRGIDDRGIDDRGVEGK